MSFILSHAREENALSPNSVDLAYSRRGPQIISGVPRLVRRGGLLAAIHPVAAPPAPPPEDIHPESYRAKIEAAGLSVEVYEVIEDRYHYPTVADLAASMSRQPGMPDVRRPEYVAILQRLSAQFRTTEGDFVIPRTYLIWSARRLGGHPSR